MTSRAVSRDLYLNAKYISVKIIVVVRVRNSSYGQSDCCSALLQVAYHQLIAQLLAGLFHVAACRPLVAVNTNAQ